MRRHLGVALGGVAIVWCGGVAGLGLANYAESGSFHFYKQYRSAAWQPEPVAASAIRTSDLAYTPPADADADFGDARITPAAYASGPSTSRSGSSQAE